MDTFWFIDAPNPKWIDTPYAFSFILPMALLRETNG